MNHPDPRYGAEHRRGGQLYQRLRGHLAVLKLHDAAEALPAVLDRAQQTNLSKTATLEELPSIEVDATEARRLAGRLRFACLPTPASLEDFDFDAAAGLDRKLIAELGTCRYLETATNLLLIGPPGVSKSDLAVGLARAAVYAGYRTYFTTAAAQLRDHHARSEKETRPHWRSHTGAHFRYAELSIFQRAPSPRRRERPGKLGDQGTGEARSIEARRDRRFTFCPIPTEFRWSSAYSAANTLTATLTVDDHRDPRRRWGRCPVEWWC